MDKDNRDKEEPHPPESAKKTIKSALKAKSIEFLKSDDNEKYKNVEISERVIDFEEFRSGLQSKRSSIGGGVRFSVNAMAQNDDKTVSVVFENSDEAEPSPAIDVEDSDSSEEISTNLNQKLKGLSSSKRSVAKSALSSQYKTGSAKNSQHFSIGDESVNTVQSDIFIHFTKYYERFSNYIENFWFAFKLLPVSFLWFPLLVAFVSSAITIASLVILIDFVLPNISWYNFMHIFLIGSAEMTAWSLNWACTELVRFTSAYKLLHSQTNIASIFSAVSGKLDKFGKFVYISTWIVRLAVIGTVYNAHWTPEMHEYGYLPCTPATYSKKSLDNIHFQPQLVQGAIEFGEINQYCNILTNRFGLSLADGIVAGSGAWPNYTPDKNFYLHGEGPVLAFQTDCDLAVSQYDGYIPPDLTGGSGSSIKDLIMGKGSIYMEFQMILPVFGFDVDELAKLGYVFNDSSSNWLVQYCRVHGMLGKGSWETEFNVDQLGSMTSGRLSSVKIGSIELKQHESSEIYANDVLHEIAIQIESNEGYNFSTPDSDGSIIIQSLESIFIEAFNGTWYYSSGGYSTSYFMCWASRTDGIYRKYLVSQGVAAAAAAVAYTIWSNFDNNPQRCNYSGFQGKGKIDLVVPIVITTCAIIVFLLLNIIANAVFYHIVFAVRNLEVFRLSSGVFRDELTRTFYCSDFIYKLAERKDFKHNSTMVISEFMQRGIRMGETKETVGTDNPVYLIGTLDSTVKIRSRAKSQV